MKIFETRNGKIIFDPATPAVVATFTDFMKSDEFREFLLVGLKHLLENTKKYGNVLWLADTSSHKIQPKSDTDWVVNEWNPRAQKGGVTHVAFVLPKDVFGQHSVTNYQQGAKKQGAINVGMFDSVESAKAWYQEDVKSLKQEV